MRKNATDMRRRKGEVMKKAKLVGSILAVLLFFFAAGHTSAATYTTYSSVSGFLTALGSVTPLIQDFNSYNSGQDLSGVQLLPGVTVTSNMTTIEAWSKSYSPYGLDLFAWDMSHRTDSATRTYYDINLSLAYNAAGFNIDAWDPNANGPGIIEVFFSDGTNASIPLSKNGVTEEDPVFFGIIANTPITKIRWNEPPEVLGVQGWEETALDDFYVAVVTPLIDPTVWADLEVVRRINNGVLESQIRRHGSNGNNYLVFYDSISVKSFQADLTVKDYENSGSFPNAGLLGFAYNDGTGTPGGGHTGDVLGVIGIRHNGSQLEGFYSITQCTAPNCNLQNEVHTICSASLGTAASNQTYPISFSWDDSTSTFTFGFGDTSIDVNSNPLNPHYCALPAYAGPPKIPNKSIGTRIAGITNGANAGGYISATFDNVYINNPPTLYDTFDSPPINRSKWWGSLELVSVIDNGELVQELTQNGANGGYNMNFVNSQAILGFEADVRADLLQNNGGSPLARLYAGLYNDGTGSGIQGDRTGDVIASVGISDNGSGGAQAFYSVNRCTAFNCNLPGEYAPLTSGIFKPVGLSETHKFSLSWDGFSVSLGCDGNTVPYNPTTPVPVAGPPKSGKGIGPRVIGIDNSSKSGYVSAAFDNVVILSTGFPLTVTKSGAGNGTVTSSPDGVNCGSDCGQGYSSGTTVMLTAAPDGNSNFTGWLVAGSPTACPGTSLTCSVTMGGPKSVVATFTAKNLTNTTTSVSSSDNPSVYGQSVTFTATVTSNPPNAPTGTVQFKIDGGNFGSPVTLLNGNATSAVTSSLVAGNHTVTAAYSGDANYTASSGTLSGGQTINKRNATITVTPYNVTYDANPHTATGTATGVNNEDLSSLLHLGGTTHTNAGDYPSDSWSFDGNTNYNNDSVTVHDVISKANASISVGYTGVYDCHAHGAAGSATGVGGVDLSGSLNLGGATFTNVPGGTDHWTFTGGTNYNDASGDVAIVISQATPTITWDNPADITNPSPLTTMQLDATASGCNGPLTGAFTYNPTSCAQLPVGNNETLSVHFKPDDTNYTETDATVSINVLEPKVSKVQISDKWICIQSDSSGFPVAMYAGQNCTENQDCSVCMTAANRCATSPVLDVTFSAGTLKWAGQGSGTVDFITSANIYRCVEGIDLCFSCGSGTQWVCDPNAPALLGTPTFNITAQEKIEDVWVCSDSPDPVSGCFTHVYSSDDATDQTPCPATRRVPWTPSALSNVTFKVTELKWVGPGSDSPSCETVYFVTASCIYKCSIDTGNCFSLCSP